MHMHSYTGASHGCKLLHFNITTITIIKLNDHLAREIQEAVYIDNLDHFDSLCFSARELLRLCTLPCRLESARSIPKFIDRHV